MAVQFILGRSGTGKTSRCIKAIVNALLDAEDDRQLILLVPEQASYQAERSILSDPRIEGYSRLHVLSFDRLQFMLLGKNTARSAISRIGREMVIHRLLREHAGGLEILGSCAGRPGLARQMGMTIAELHQYGQTREDLDRLISRLEGDEGQRASLLKFRDIRLIFAEYMKFIEGRFIDPDVQLSLACREAGRSELVRGARLWVDGFAGFTGAELDVLMEMLKVAEESHIALCLDAERARKAGGGSGKIDQAGLFFPTELTYRGLMERIREAGLEQAEPEVLETAHRFAGFPGAAYLERNIFRPGARAAKSGGGIRIVSAPNERGEVRFVASEIVRLVRQEGYRYRDIAVIASDIESYQHYVRAAFADSGIPYFIDRRRPLNQHPVVQLISSALESVTGDFSSSAVFSYLKTDLVPISRADVDLLENYCTAFGIRGGDWQSEKAWSFAGDGDDDFDDGRADAIRRSAVCGLVRLGGALHPGGGEGHGISAARFTEAVFGLLEELGVRRTLASWIEDGGVSGGSDEHEQFYSRLIDVFDELNEVFAGVTMPAGAFRDLLNWAFSQLTLAFIPPKLDQVLVGSIERSRHPELRAAFLIGATQRQFPVPAVSESILSDADRSAADSADFSLGASTGRRLSERQYLAYIGFTRACEYLCVTYPGTDRGGGAVCRSQYVGELEALFEDVTEEKTAGVLPDIRAACTKSELADILCERLSRDRTGGGVDAEAAGLLEEMGSDSDLCEVGGMVASAVGYENIATLDDALVESLFGRELRSSATGLGTYAACPYQYFVRYVLRLKERREFKLEPLDVGNFYHRVLDRLTRRLGAEGSDFGSAGDERLPGLVREEIMRLSSEDAFISNFAGHSPHNGFIIESAAEVLEDCVLEMAEMVRAGSLRPALSEVSFGNMRGEERRPGGYEVSLGGGRRLVLSGKIDRLDVAEANGEKVAVVFDYKLSGKGFNWSHFYYGLDMQLPIYMLAVGNAAGSRAGRASGAFYVAVDVRPTKATLDELVKQEGVFRRKAKGVFNGDFHRILDGGDSNKYYNFYVTKQGDQYGYAGWTGALAAADFERLLRYTQHKLASLGEEILSGRIEVRPYSMSKKTPCSYCKHRAVCRFDWQINDYNYLTRLKKSEVLEAMGASDG